MSSNLLKTEQEVKNDYKNLLETLAKNDKNLVWFLLGSLISADTIVDITSCENSIKILNELLESVDKISDELYTLEEKAEIKKFCNEGIDICNKDLNSFKENEKVV